MILYFNCRIVGRCLTPNNKDNGYFYPQVYPKQFNEQIPDNQLEVLLKTIQSYSKIKFEWIIFNLAIDLLDDIIENRIRQLIDNEFPNTKIILNFSRPSTIKRWIEDVTKIGEIVGLNSPVVVAMNHDHPFADFNGSVFMNCVENLFGKDQDNLGKVFYYSHAPEVISWSINGRGETEYIEVLDGIYESTVIDNWVDSIGVMTLSTLLNIWNKAKFEGDYIGRFDWTGVSYSKLELRTYVFPREFFRHFDGYNHLTGMRLISEMKISDIGNQTYPEGENYHIILNYYYAKWIDSFIFLVRDFIKLNFSYNKSKRELFVAAIEKTIDMFNIGYLKTDSSMGLIDPEMMSSLQVGLRNKIYFNANYLYQQIITDIELSKRSDYQSIKYACLSPLIFIKNRLRLIKDKIFKNFEN